MNREQEKVKTIYIGYHPRTHDGVSVKTTASINPHHMMS